MLDVFISYPHSATNDAKQLAESLRSTGLKTWYAEENLVPGGDWKGKVTRAMRDAQGVAFIIVPHSQPSSWMQEEYMAGLESFWTDNKKVLTPVLIGNAQPPTFLRQWRAVKIEKKSDFKKAAVQIMRFLTSPETSRIEFPKAIKEKRAQRMHNLEEIMRQIRIDELILAEALPEGSNLDRRKLREQINAKMQDVLEMIDREGKTSKAKR